MKNVDFAIPLLRLTILNFKDFHAVKRSGHSLASCGETSADSGSLSTVIDLFSEYLRDLFDFGEFL